MNAIAKGINATQLNKTLPYVSPYSQTPCNIAEHVRLQVGNAASTLFLANLAFQADELEKGHDYLAILAQAEILTGYACDGLTKITTASIYCHNELKLMNIVKATISTLLNGGMDVVLDESAAEIMYGLEDTLRQVIAILNDSIEQLAIESIKNNPTIH